jgi:uncharacterized membrane protein YdcZ (DUF606 family)
MTGATLFVLCPVLGKLIHDYLIDPCTVLVVRMHYALWELPVRQ